MVKKILKIDFGSGYNPHKEYKTCDITFLPTLDYVFNICDYTITDLKENTVDEFYLRNVVHHIKDLDSTFKMLYKYLKPNGIIKIIDTRKEYFMQNIILDIIWYRYVIPRYEIWFSTKYRNYFNTLEQLKLKLIHKEYLEEKEVSIWKKL